MISYHLPKTRWCTRQLKLRPFEQWLRPKLEDGETIYSYVAIRSDEEYREGYASKNERLIVRLPFKEVGIDKAGVLEILDSAGLGLPTYYSWRTRSGCTFCFFQQKIEWVRLKEQHPEAFEEAKAYEKNSVEHVHPSHGVKAKHWKNWKNQSGLSKSGKITDNVLHGCVPKFSPIPYGPTMIPWILMIYMDRRRFVLACHK